MMTHKALRLVSTLATVWMLLLTTSCSLLKPSFKGEAVDPITPAPQIDMTDQYGDSFRLDAQQGKVVLLFFGFTNCVDECPLAMAHIKVALGTLAERASDVRVVLVSTDPVRDTPQAMDDFLRKFDPSYVGITGSLDDLQNIWNDYGVVVLDGGETHTSLIYAVDPNGDLRLQMAAEAEPEDIASDLKILLDSE